VQTNEQDSHSSASCQHRPNSIYDAVDLGLTKHTAIDNCL